MGFEKSLNNLRSSKAANDFPWLSDGALGSLPGSGWALPITAITSDKELTMDPKRLCEKFAEVRGEIIKKSHFCLSDVVDFIPEAKTLIGDKITRIPEQQYLYVELQNIVFRNTPFGFTILHKLIIYDW